MELPGGPHVWPGAALSRLEAAVALPALHGRCPRAARTLPPRCTDAAPALHGRCPELGLAGPATELRNKPVVTQNDLFELPVRLGG